MAESIVVTVPLGERSYPVHVGHGARSALPSLIPATARRTAVITQAGIPLGDDVSAALERHGLDVTRVEIGTGESQKSLTTVEHLAGAFAGAGITRHDVVVAVGGGMVTDVAGFAAAVWHRGVPVVHVSTTLLGMVDAAIGGKTGVNTREGKNLVGAFWQPSGVICDLDALDTLPAPRTPVGRRRDGEVPLPHGRGPGRDAARRAGGPLRRDQGRRRRVDEREGGRRALLNYGHTLAHALEIATDHDLTHGEAVGIGLVYAAELAHDLGRIDADRVERAPRGRRRHLRAVDRRSRRASTPTS